MNGADYLILGAGPAGCRAAQTIRRRDRQGRVILLTDERVPFTNRILLSKEFLTSDDLPPERAVVLPPGSFHAQSIELRTQERIERLDPEARSVELASGEKIAYGKCLIATGSRPLELPVPGFDLPGVHTLRTIEDAVALREHARGADRAVVIGGGLIGAEIACALSLRGLPVTLVARERWLWGHIAPESVGRAVGEALRARGVELRLGGIVVAIQAAGSQLVVECGDGELLRAPLVAAGVGVRYNVEFLADTNLLEPGRGVRVDRWLETEAPGLWAAGDVGAFDDPVFGCRHHVEHWLHAQHQGRTAGENMTGERKVYRRASRYDTRLFDLAVTVVGAPELAERWTEEEPIAAGTGTALGWSRERLVAAYRLGAGGAIEAIARRIGGEAEAVVSELTPPRSPGSP
ncbi:MAG TPA: NAD(P)/FAD-dependent oxidoreductase [Gemmatimonadota bacterium]|nr:NAD(P)/FAD-dependent oxidoreductase [Gemmatimonadota bacterium]